MSSLPSCFQVEGPGSPQTGYEKNCAYFQRHSRISKGLHMARITIEDCQERVENRFLLVQMTIKRVRQLRRGYQPLVESNNKEIVTALREIAAGKILPEDLSQYKQPANAVQTSKVSDWDD